MNAADQELAEALTENPMDEWRIGFILIRAGRLKKEDVTKVIQFQRQNGMRFGDAAIALGVLCESDVRFALARQFDYPYVVHGESQINKLVVAAYQPDCAASERLRALRSQLTMGWLESPVSGRKTLAIAGLDRKSGRSWLAANLAVIFSQLGKTTVLIDADLRNPTQHLLFGFDNRQGLSEVLCGRASLPAIAKKNRVLPNLTVISSGASPPNPQEVIANRGLEQLFRGIEKSSDVVIVDTPADAQASDGQIIAKYAGNSLLVAKRQNCRVRSLASYVAKLRTTGTNLVASVLVD